ncbi:MAG TPA: radical SAM protein [Puia sp.]|nr:radical SAM protein [Puia sp.]
MYQFSDYASRGFNFLHNRLAPGSKRLSSLMLYATDRCDSGCKHCLIWAKRPTTVLPLEAIVRIMQSKCIHPSTMVGLEGGEFLLHPEAEGILEWFSVHHRNFDLFSNCLDPGRLIRCVRTYRPHRLYISLDGDRDTYLHMRGKDGYDRVLRVIRELKDVLPVFVMFTLSPYNDFGDLRHVAGVCRENGVFLRVGIYDNIPFFDTIEDAPGSAFGQYKNEEVLTYAKVREMRTASAEASEGEAAFAKASEGEAAFAKASEGEEGEAAFAKASAAEEGDSGEGAAFAEASAGEAAFAKASAGEAAFAKASAAKRDFTALIPEDLREYAENYDYVRLYQNWVKRKLRLGCHSILDSAIVLPDGDVPICQHLPTRLGNIFRQSLDEIFNSPESNKVQRHHSRNCNQCWVAYHRKYDIALYRSFEKTFGRWATTKLLGYYTWGNDND